MRWRILPLMMLVIALAHFNRISITVVGAEKLIKEDVISDVKMGLVYSSYLLLYTLFMMPGGWFIDHFGPRRAWMVLGFGSSVFIALTGWAGLLFTTGMSLWFALMCVRGLMGITSAPLHPTGARLVDNWIPHSGACLANGLLNCAALVGIAFTYLIFGALMDRYGWPGALFACSVVTLLVALLWTLTATDYPSERVPPRHHASSLPPLEHFRAMLTNRSMICLTLSYAAVGYFQYLFFYWAQFYFNDVRHVPKQTSRDYATILSLAMAGGMVVGGWVSDRAEAWYGSRRGLAIVPVLSLLFSAVAVGVGLVVEEVEDVLICFAVAMAAVGMSEGSFWTAAVKIGGSRGGSAASILNTGGNAGGLLAPALTPIISRVFGWQAGLGMASGVCLIAALLWLWITPEAPESAVPPSHPHP
jgi:MFS family permease